MWLFDWAFYSQYPPLSITSDPLFLWLFGSIRKIAHNWNSSDSCIWTQWILANRQILCSEWMRQRSQEREKAEACDAARAPSKFDYGNSFIVYFPFSWTVGYGAVFHAIWAIERDTHTHTECICMGMVFIVRLWLFIWANCVRVKCQSPMFIHVYMLSMRQWHGMCWYLASAKQPQNTHNFTFNSISPTHFVSTYIQQLAGMY